MGIKRCPYCRALISDQDEFCKNCGTRLLFPEDEIEEPIPGDKIIEDDRRPEGRKKSLKSGVTRIDRDFSRRRRCSIRWRGRAGRRAGDGRRTRRSHQGSDEEAAHGQKTRPTLSGSRLKERNPKVCRRADFYSGEEELPFPEEQKEKMEPGLVTRMVEELQKR